MGSQRQLEFSGQIYLFSYSIHLFIQQTYRARKMAGIYFTIGISLAPNDDFFLLVESELCPSRSQLYLKYLE